jgi:hypothetical protein
MTAMDNAPFFNGKSMKWLIDVMRTLEMFRIKDAEQLKQALTPQRAANDWSGY